MDNAIGYIAIVAMGLYGLIEIFMSHKDNGKLKRSAWLLILLALLLTIASIFSTHTQNLKEARSIKDSEIKFLTTLNNFDSVISKLYKINQLQELALTAQNNTLDSLNNANKLINRNIFENLTFFNEILTKSDSLNDKVVSAYKNQINNFQLLEDSLLQVLVKTEAQYASLNNLTDVVNQIKMPLFPVHADIRLKYKGDSKAFKHLYNQLYKPVGDFDAYGTDANGNKFALPMNNLNSLTIKGSDLEGISEKLLSIADSCILIPRLNELEFVLNERQFDLYTGDEPIIVRLSENSTDPLKALKNNWNTYNYQNITYNYILYNDSIYIDMGDLDLVNETNYPNNLIVTDIINSLLIVDLSYIKFSGLPLLDSVEVDKINLRMGEPNSYFLEINKKYFFSSQKKQFDFNDLSYMIARNNYSKYEEPRNIMHQQIIFYFIDNKSLPKLVNKFYFK